MTCDPVSVGEIAEILGVTRQRINQLMHEHEDFPKPFAELAIGRVWKREDIETWAKSLNRRPGRRPSGSGTNK
jgi:predicted DNA-binding transcriptional regulator AlpA